MPQPSLGAGRPLVDGRFRRARHSRRRPLGMLERVSRPVPANTESPADPLTPAICSANERPAQQSVQIHSRRGGLRHREPLAEPGRRSSGLASGRPSSPRAGWSERDRAADATHLGSLTLAAAVCFNTPIATQSVSRRSLASATQLARRRWCFLMTISASERRLRLEGVARGRRCRRALRVSAPSSS
jgi:hypothetical protein